MRVGCDNIKFTELNSKLRSWCQMINNKACAEQVEEKFSRKIENLVMLLNKYYQNKGKVVYVTNTSNHSQHSLF